MGDYNINLLEYDTDNSVHNFMNTVLSHSFYPTIDKPTRITAESATLIDNILNNDLVNHSTVCFDYWHYIPSSCIPSYQQIQRKSPNR